jgi:M6 family metalloprotease-like protein
VGIRPPRREQKEDTVVITDGGMARLRVFFGLIASSGVMLGALAVGSAAAPERSAEPTEASSSRHGVACSAAVKRRRAAALRRYRRKMPAERRAYFRRHRSAKARRAFVRRQNAKLRRLQRALAACSRRPRPIVTPRADVAIAFTAAPPSATSARRLAYRVTATNHGPAHVPEASILVARPPTTTTVSTAGWSCSGDSVVSCAIGPLAVGESKTVEVVLRPHGLGTLSVEAEALTYGPDDPNAANNRTTATTEVRVPPVACPPTLWAGINPVFLTEGDPGEEAIAAGARGTAPAVMIFADFSDAPATESTTALYDVLVPEAARYLSAASYGRFSIQVTPHHRWVRMPSESSSYASMPHHVMRDAIAAADGEVDFRPFSMVYVIVPPTSRTRTFGYIVAPGQGASADGVELRHGVFMRSSTQGHVTPPSRANILVHEIGHPLGLPDLYDFSATTWPANSSFVGAWDPMGGPTNPMGEFLAWHKWKLGWLDAPQVGCLAGPGTVEETLTPLGTAGGVKAIVALTGPSTAIVAEARRRVGEDADLCEEGVLVYTVDATVASGAGPVRVRAAQPDGANQAMCEPLYEAPFDVGPDEVSRFDDPAAGVTVEVIASSPDGYRVRVTKR